MCRSYRIQLERYLNGSIYGTYNCIVAAPTIDDAIRLATARLSEGAPSDIKVTFHIINVSTEQ